MICKVKTRINIFIDCNKYENELIKRPKQSNGNPETLIMDGSLPKAIRVCINHIEQFIEQNPILLIIQTFISRYCRPDCKSVCLILFKFLIGINCSDTLVFTY